MKEIPVANLHEMLLSTLRHDPGYARRVSALAIAPDGTLIATGNTDELTRLWQVK